jgi:hypothetical protein
MAIIEFGRYLLTWWLKSTGASYKPNFQTTNTTQTHKEKHKTEKPHIMKTQKPDDAEDDDLVNLWKLVVFPLGSLLTSVLMVLFGVGRNRPIVIFLVGQ